MFNDRPAKAEPKSWSDGHAVYDIGIWTVKVSPEGEVSYWRQSQSQSSDPRHLLPNIEADDEALRIPVEDLAEVALQRMEPDCLARELWKDERVRLAFMDEMARQYATSLSENDRRRFLAQVQATVHDETLDRLVELMHQSEFAFTKRAHFSHQVREANELLRENECRDRSGNLIQLRGVDSVSEHEISIMDNSSSWQEARDYWRVKVLAYFEQVKDTTHATDTGE